jgi:hypothetical protein
MHTDFGEHFPKYCMRVICVAEPCPNIDLPPAEHAKISIAPPIGSDSNRLYQIRVSLLRNLIGRKKAVNRREMPVRNLRLIKVLKPFLDLLVLSDSIWGEAATRRFQVVA